MLNHVLDEEDGVELLQDPVGDRDERVGDDGHHRDGRDGEDHVGDDLVSPVGLGAKADHLGQQRSPFLLGFLSSSLVSFADARTTIA